MLRRALPAVRMPAAFLQLGRNAEWWSANAPPRRRARATAVRRRRRARRRARDVPGDGRLPVVSRAGPRSSSSSRRSAAPTRCRACMRPSRAGARVRAASELRLLLDGMVPLAVDAAAASSPGSTASRSAAAAPPWISGLAQGTGIQAFTRGAQLLGDPAYLEVARQALGAFEAPPPTGVRGRRRRRARTTSSTRSRAGPARAQRVPAGARRASTTSRRRRTTTRARGAVQRRRPGRRGASCRASTPARGRCTRRAARSPTSATTASCATSCARCATGRGTAAYCATRTRFDRYLHQRTARGDRLTGRRRAGRTIAVRVTLSKVSCVTLRLRRGGRVVSRRTLVLAARHPDVRRCPRRPGRTSSASRRATSWTRGTPSGGRSLVSANS